ncbi:MAG: hypothetical protein WCP96_06595 [Methylococcaceae bacterium]
MFTGFWIEFATHILAFEGEDMGGFKGNYEDYETVRHRRLGSDADNPHRLKYKNCLGLITKSAGKRT